MKTDTMKLLQIRKPEHAVWQEAPVPEPRPGEILLKVTGVATCPHWDLHIYGGEPMMPDRPIRYPYTPGEPGHEAVGEVADVGKGVEDVEVGTRVALWRDPGGRRQGCYAQFVAVRAEDVLRVPVDLPDASLASLELAMCVQVSLDQLMDRGDVAGKRVAVSGLGPSGLVAVQMARAYGAREVIGFDPVPERREKARALGADTVYDPADAMPPPGRNRPASFDSAIDTAGLSASVRFLVERTNRTVTVFGVLREFVGFGPENWWGGFALLGYGVHSRGAAERALILIRNGSLQLAPLITHELPFTEYREGVELLRRREAIKVLFRPW